MRRAFWVVLLALFCLPAAGLAQGAFGSLGGIVSDPSAAVVADAKVVITNTATGVKSESTTSAAGSYQIFQLSPGSYTLEVEAKGFKTLKRSGITIQVGDKLELNLSLEVGEISETVDVSAEAPLLRTTDAQVGEVVTNKMIQNMPQLNRDPLALLRLSGNVQGDGGRAGGGNDTRINGGRTAGVEYFSDGVTVGTGRGHEVSRVSPTMESVAEFKVVTNGLSAEYGRFSGGVVEMATQSGTNAIHGQVFDYIQNDIFNANSWNQNRLGGEKTPFRRNNFGVAVGGPVWIPKVYNGKNKTFFFFNYDGVRYTRSGSLNTADTLTEAERNGDFTGRFKDGLHMGDPLPPGDVDEGQPMLLWDPNGQTTTDSKGNVVRLTKLGGDGMHVPTNRIHPVSAAILKMYPLPNRTPQANSSSFSNYMGAQDGTARNDGWSVKLDQFLSANHKIFGRFGYMNQRSGNTRWRGDLSAADSDEYKGGFNATINYDWTLSPTMLLNARVGGFFNPIDKGNSLGADFDNSFIPFHPQIKAILGTEGMAWVGASAQNGWYSDSPSLNKTHSTTFNPSVSMVKILNKHTLKFGYEHRRYYDNFFSTGGGQFVFQQNHINRLAIDNAWNTPDAVRAPASLLLGYFSWGSISGNKARSMAVNYHGAYIQDDFKVSSKLTLNLGLRWDMETPTTERYNRLYVWDPEAPSTFSINSGWTWEGALKDAGFTDSQIAGIPKPSWVTGGMPKGAVKVAGNPDHPSRLGTEYKPWQFAPRVGAAYQINDKTVLRGSFGQIYMSTTGDPNGLSGSGGNTVLADTADTGWHANQFGTRFDVGTWDNPFLPGNIKSFSRETAQVNRDASGNLQVWNSKSHQPWEFVWSGGISREIGRSMVVEANYTGNRGVDLLGSDLISHFPKELFKPELRDTYIKRVKSPFAGQVSGGNGAEDSPPLAMLMYPYAAYGVSALTGSNTGKSQFHALNLRAERRFAHGWGFLVNYTLSRLKDNVGGPESFGSIGQNGIGSHDVQTVETMKEIYEISPLDETHRFSLIYNVELPFGKGRRYLGSIDSTGKKVLDYIVGGWEVAGISQWRSGRPVFMNTEGININNDVRVEHTWMTSSGPIGNDSFSWGSSAFRSVDDNVSGAVSRFNEANLKGAAQFTYGTVNPLQPGIRNPGRWSDDFSLMKKFAVAQDGRVYLQVRAEAFNLFNRMVLDNFNVTKGDARFGLITQAVPDTERRMQMSLRLVW